MTAGDDYFDGPMPERQALLWACAVRRQLGRWEPLVALHFLTALRRDHQWPGTRTITHEEIWRGEVEHHFLLIAARNLLRAIELLDDPPDVDSVTRAELIEVRDLLEHWTENMPIFNITPRPKAPRYRSGQDFADRNPRNSPYGWWNWDNQRGPHVTPNVSADDLRALADQVISVVIAKSPELEDFVPMATPSPWLPAGEEGERWWPDRDVVDGSCD